MHPAHLTLQEPIRLGAILESSAVNPFPALTKVIGTLGPKSRSLDTIEELLKAGMSVARFDFSWGSHDYHQETLATLRKAIKNTQRPCAVMLDTIGPELQILNRKEKPIVVEAESMVVLTPDKKRDASSDVLPVNYEHLSKSVKPGDTIFVGQYLFTGSENTSVWLEVVECRGKDVHCRVKNSATLVGSVFTAYASQIHISLPTLSDGDKQTIQKWGVPNAVDIVSVSYTRQADDIREARAQLAALGAGHIQVFAKVENAEGLRHFDEILRESDGVILSRGNLGIDLPPEKVFLIQKGVLHRCNMAGKVGIITRVVDSMVETPRPTRAEATDIANGVLDGADGILLGAETLRGLYPIQTIATVQHICAEAEKVYNHNVYFQQAVAAAGEPMDYLESIASSAVRAASSVAAAMIIVLSSSGRAARLVAKYRPPVPILVVLIPKPAALAVVSQSSSASAGGTAGAGASPAAGAPVVAFNGTSQFRQCMAVRGLMPLQAAIASPEAILKAAIDYGKSVGIVKQRAKIVVCQKAGDSYAMKMLDLDDTTHDNF